MTLIAATFEKIPEVLLEDPNAIQEHFLRLRLETNLAGFVIRQIGSDPDEVHAKLQIALDGVVDLGERCDQFYFPMDERGDAGYHIDVEDGRKFADVTRVNETTVQEGEVEFDLFNLKVPYAARHRLGANTVNIMKFDPEQYEVGRFVDDEFVIPIGYRGILKVGDALIFPDAASPHDFRTLREPRRSTASLHRVHLLAGHYALAG